MADDDERVMDPDALISPEMIEQLNRAAALAREGRLEEALSAWNQLLGPQPRRVLVAHRC